mmetsp:Transcript_20097/g.57493  ORF Transcript_20097/g.57493 Transcript_20097/m.57493 type:complete len:241 (-) Transcript_20097:848-1570(-)
MWLDRHTECTDDEHELTNVPIVPGMHTHTHPSLIVSAPPPASVSPPSLSIVVGRLEKAITAGGTGCTSPPLSLSGVMCRRTGSADSEREGFASETPFSGFGACDASRYKRLKMSPSLLRFRACSVMAGLKVASGATRWSTLVCWDRSRRRRCMSRLILSSRPGGKPAFRKTCRDAFETTGANVHSPDSFSCFWCICCRLLCSLSVAQRCRSDTTRAPGGLSCVLCLLMWGARSCSLSRRS